MYVADCEVYLERIFAQRQKLHVSHEVDVKIRIYAGENAPKSAGYPLNPLFSGNCWQGTKNISRSRLHNPSAGTYRLLLISFLQWATLFRSQPHFAINNAAATRVLKLKQELTETVHPNQCGTRL